MSTSELPPPVTLVQMMTGYWISQSIYVAKLGIADLLRDGPRTSEGLAAACQAHAGSLYRLMRGLASVSVFTEIDGRRLPSRRPPSYFAPIIRATET